MQKLIFDVNGMSCAACAATVEKAAKGCRGVENAEVQLLANRLVVNADDQNPKELEDAICQAVSKAGYGAFPPTKKPK